MITDDFHLHSDFSDDSSASMEEMICRGIEAGLSGMCFTEHLDLDFPTQYGMSFGLATEQYRETFLAMQARYADRMTLHFGIELGLQPHLAGQLAAYVQEWPFDFVIGSTHIVDGQDPYYPEFYEDRSEDEAYEAYFASILANLQSFDDIDVYGHLDYVVRYGPNQNRYYTYEKFQDVLEEILHLLVEKGIGLECNTGGYKRGLGQPNPCVDILKRYRELGGEILTIGSDAHAPVYIAHAFDRASDLLKACGYRYYTVFQERRPRFIRL